MITNHNIAPSSILCVTFTNKAAKEMRLRFSKALWVDISQVNMYSRSIPLIATFHSFWVFLLRQDIESLWYDKSFVIYDETDKVSLIKWILKELDLDIKQFPPAQIGYHISHAKNALVTPKMFETYVDNPFKEIVCKVYAEYEKNCIKNNSLDFDDILIKALDILQKPDLLAKYHERFKYVLVDEYQDTNKIQYEMTRLLALKYKNLCVVGDDWQSIYSWRWADMTNIINFKKDYPNAKEIKLEQNYRSTNIILDAANMVIQKNQSALKKKLWSDNHSDEKIKIIEATDEKVEASVISKVIAEAGAPYSSNVILYRTNGQSRQLEEALMVQWIPYKIFWWQRFYDRMEIKDILSYLRVIYNPRDNVSLMRIINTPSRKIWLKTLEIINMYRSNFQVSWIQILENIDEVSELPEWAKRNIKWFFEIYSNLKKYSQKIVVKELIQLVLKSTWYDEYLRSNYNQTELDARMDNITELENLASHFDEHSPYESLQKFLEEIALVTDYDREDPQKDYVTLMTLHMAKWLEFDRVIISWLEEGLFPHIRSLENAKELEEERRLMYVWITRAKTQLYLSYAWERFTFWNYVRNPKSRFIDEFDQELREYLDLWAYYKPTFNYGSPFSKKTEIQLETTETKPKKKPQRNNDTTQFSLWDMVEHDMYWKWTIVALNEDIWEIAFRWAGIKKMNLKIAPVQKV